MLCSVVSVIRTMTTTCIRNLEIGLTLACVLILHASSTKLDDLFEDLLDDTEYDHYGLDNNHYGSNEPEVDDKDEFVCKRIPNGGGSRLTNGKEQVYKEKIRTLEGKLEAMERKLDTLLPSISPDVISLAYNTVPTDCAQLYDKGVRTDGTYTVSPDGRCPFEVYCDMTNGGWTTIQRRHTANLHFNRTWDEYASGFGDLEQDFWLGLDKIHRLTQSGSRVHFRLGHYGRRNRFDWAEYRGFVVQDVISGYAMNVDTFGYNGTLPELFSYHDGEKFSTFDRDQDSSSDSCSKTMGGGGGWWFGSCYRLGVLNGLFGEKNKGGNSYWDYGDMYIKTTEMKVKPLVGSC